MPFPEIHSSFPYTTIIWDWNGTLLNDLTHCVTTINILLKERHLPLLSDSLYREVFSFPVREYYEKVGFDFIKEDFSVPARQFIERYNAGIRKCSLHTCTKKVLKTLQARKIRQFVLSAMKQDMLEETLRFHGILPVFENVAGLGDHYAVSKVERGRELLDASQINPEKTCMIGDTLHDFEVARELGISCILIADGHQSKKRLETSGVKVLPSLADLLPLVM